MNANLIDSGSSGLCGEHCEWKLNDLSGIYELIQSCSDPAKYCEYPLERAAFRARRNRCTECRPLEDARELCFLEYREASPTRRYFVMLPKIENPKEIARAGNLVPVNGFGQFVSTTYGWLIWLRNREKNGSPAAFSPATLPLDAPIGAERALTVGLKLQEEGGALNEYWAPVTASRPWCTLTTPEWDVQIVALRSLIPAESA